jgi:hypothetical protein
MIVVSVVTLLTPVRAISTGTCRVVDNVWGKPTCVDYRKHSHRLVDDRIQVW